MLQNNPQLSRLFFQASLDKTSDQGTTATTLILQR